MVRDLYARFRPTRTRVAATMAMAALMLVGGCGKDATRVEVRTAASVVVTPGTASIIEGGFATFTATVLDQAGVVIDGAAVGWTSSDTLIATVNSAGVVSAKIIGAATITAVSGSASGSAQLAVAAAAPAPPPFNHVFVVGLLEKDYATVFPAGAPAMPFLDSLRLAGGSATQYFGNAHPSIGNFYMLAVGDTVTTDDNDTTMFSGDNLVRQMAAGGKTWKSYAESIPGVGYMGPDQGLYSRHHNIFVHLSDVRNSAAQRQNIVPLTRLATDISGNTLPNFGMIVPNECNNSHNCPLSQVDSWLRTTLTPLIQSAAFQQSGLLIILFDRAATSTVNGGGRVAWVVVSPKAKAGYTSSTVFQHQSTLRLTLNALGLGTGPGGVTQATPGLSSSAPSMMEFFNLP